jgi:CheY-like chemotaxis protein
VPAIPDLEARSTLPGAPPLAQPNQGTILVVEPDAEKRTVLVKCLTDAGYVVLALGDGPAAIEVMGQEPERYVAAIVGEFSDSDLTCEVARVLRALSPNTAVVLTSFADYSRFLAVSTDTSRCAVLSRPYRAETVTDLFRTIMPNPSLVR